MARYGMLIDLKSCNGCRACMTACKGAHNIPFGQHKGREYYRIWPEEVEQGTYPYVLRSLTPMLCMHCENPPCAKACPIPGAIFTRQAGIVLIDGGKCNGCQACIPACPYGALYFREDKEKVDKCTFCVENIDRGLVPECVRACPVEAIFFGNLDDPDSTIAKRIQEWEAKPPRPELGTQPAIFYTAHAAQLRGAVESRETGHPVPGATVIAQCLNNGEVNSTSTDSEGIFFFWCLRVRKKYLITIEAQGLARSTRELYLEREYTDSGRIVIS